MEREEQIKQAAEINYGSMYHKYPMEYFTEGAKWADAHPQSPWKSVKDTPIEDGNFVIGFNKAWIDEDFNPQGIRIGFMSNGEFISAYWWDYQDDFISISKSTCEGNPEFYKDHIGNTEPTHWMQIPEKL